MYGVMETVRIQDGDRIKVESRKEKGFIKKQVGPWGLTWRRQDQSRDETRR